MSLAPTDERLGRTADGPARPPLPVPLRTIHVIGRPAAGKTTLARRLGLVTGLPVHHLDEVARVGGGTGRIRTAEERDRLVDAILSLPGVVTEGVHVGWTDPLLARADLIVWLDMVWGGDASVRLIDRFLGQAWASFRERTWRERLAAIPAYAGHLRDLVTAIVEARRYDRSIGRPSAPAEADAASEADLEDAGGSASHARTEVALRPHRDRLVRCMSGAEVEGLVAWIADGAATPTAQTPARPDLGRALPAGAPIERSPGIDPSGAAS